MKKNYNTEKVVEQLKSRGFTNFINQSELKTIKGKLSKNEYKIYNLYDESNKVILYKKNIPEISLLKLDNSSNLRHQEVLGTIYSLGIKEDTFGDIIKINDNYYIFILPTMVSYIKNNLTKIKNNYITIEEVSIKTADKFIQDYVEKEIIVSSLRIDNVISTLINCSRNEILSKFKDKEILLNYEAELKPTKTLKPNDIFSIRGYGKYKYIGTIKETKKGSYLIKIFMYK